MIISHKHKYILLRPAKVAGTSIQINMAKHCGEKDIIAPIAGFSAERDGDSYTLTPQNHEGFHTHIEPDEVRKKVGEEIWNEYLKITIARNPWDEVVSRFWYLKHTSPSLKRVTPARIRERIFSPKAYATFLKAVYLGFTNKFMKKPAQDEFELFVKKHIDIEEEPPNDKFYFDSEGKPLCDFYLRFEDLDGTYKELCNKIRIPYEQLPVTKNKTRKSKKHYSTYYNDYTKEVVSRKYNKRIEFFKYKF